MKMTTKHLLGCAAIGAAFTTTTQAAPIVLLSNDFTNATRVGASPNVQGVDADGGTTKDWVAAVNGNAAMATGANATDVGTGINGNSLYVTNTAQAYSLATTFGSVSLADGDKLSLTLDIRTTGAAAGAGAGAFRVGLFNSGALLLPSNNQTLGGDQGGGVFSYSDDTGYFGYYSTTATPALNVKVQERFAGYNVSPFGASGTPAATADVTAGVTLVSGSAAVAVDTTYAVTFDILRTGANVSISTSFNGASATSAVDSVTPFLTFNQVGLFFGSQFGNSTTPRQNFVDNVVVTYTPVPEPTTLALAGLALLGLKRRRA